MIFYYSLPRHHNHFIKGLDNHRHERLEVVRTPACQRGDLVDTIGIEGEVSRVSSSAVIPRGHH